MSQFSVPLNPSAMQQVSFHYYGTRHRSIGQCQFRKRNSAIINFEIEINRKIRKDANDDDDKSGEERVCGGGATRLDKLL